MNRSLTSVHGNPYGSGLEAVPVACW